jgi:ribosomal protein S18 acetylase RimI-like enzyme
MFSFAALARFAWDKSFTQRRPRAKKSGEMEIRKAHKGDIDALIGFNEAMALETEGKALYTGTLRKGVEAVFEDPQKGFYLVAEDAGRVIGGLMVTFEWSDWRNGWFWWIQSVYVIPEFRGNRVYSQLYEFAKREAGSAGNVCGFRLYVEKENTHAQRVYEKLGMVKTYYLMYEEKI